MKAFWNKLKRHHHSKTSSSLSANDLAQHYQSVMADAETDLNKSQRAIKNFVNERAMTSASHKADVCIKSGLVKDLVKSLKMGTSPGSDGVTVEHLSYGMSPVLASVLANVYSVILSNAVVSSVFATGVIIPILKKPSSDPNVPNDYRPITLSSVHSKLIEMIIMPSHDICDTQFGFREGRGTAFVTSMVNDCASYYKAKGSPMYLCSLDAEKCFDSIWHAGLLYKLWPILPLHHWLFVYRWYESSKAVVSWNGDKSFEFDIARGMRQGSVLSPTLFNIFLDELLHDLRQQKDCIRIFDLSLNSCTYADDITLFCSTAPGL
jgi:hypothetical protein